MHENFLYAITQNKQLVTYNSISLRHRSVKLMFYENVKLFLLLAYLGNNILQELLVLTKQQIFS